MKKNNTLFYKVCYITSFFALILPSLLFGQDENAAAKKLVEKKCSICHSVERAYGADKTHAEWEKTVKKMIRYSDQMNFLNQKEQESIVDFLASRKKIPQADTE